MTPCPKPASRVKVPKPPKPRSRIKPKNVKRSRDRFETDFGGKDYLAYIHSLPCDVCGIQGYTVAAHLTSRGAGGKAEDTAPLCRTRWQIHELRRGTEIISTKITVVDGCHERYDAHDPSIRAHEPRLRKLARERYKAFQELNRTTND